MTRTKSIATIICLALAAAAAGCGKQAVALKKGNAQSEVAQCLNLSAKGKHEDAIQCFEIFKSRYPQTAEGQEAELLIGDSHFARKDYLLAAESYEAFLRLYPSHPRGDYAMYRIGVCYYKEAPKAIDRDQENLDLAIDKLRMMLRRYPQSDYREPAIRTLQVALKRVARRHFYVGRFYYRTGEYTASIPRFSEIAENFPDSGLADRSLYLMVSANLKLKQLEGARDAFSKLSTRYPASQYTKKAEHMMLSATKKSS